MNCLTPSKKFEKGFTLIELIVVIAIFIIFIAVSESAFFNFQSHSNLEIATVNLVESLRHAKANAQQVQGDSKWGVEIFGSQITVFSSSSDYNHRNLALDQASTLTSGVSSGGLSEIVFEKVTGTTLNSGTITLSGNNGSKVITINAKGTITY